MGDRIEPRCLICRVHDRLCALPLQQVVETLRPLPVEPMAGVAEWVLGLSLIRGAPVPVVNLARLLGMGDPAIGRFITLSIAQRTVALAVSDVLGVRELPPEDTHELPPLLQGAAEQAVSELARLDGGLLLVLEAARCLPENTWSAV
jgi:purine-binding chemotaxis protein CheW